MFTFRCIHAYSDWSLSVIGKPNIMLTYNYVMVLGIKGNYNFQHCVYIHIIDIPINNGANSYKLKISKIWNYSLTLVLLEST